MRHAARVGDLRSVAQQPEAGDVGRRPRLELDRGLGRRARLSVAIWRVNRRINARLERCRA